MPSTFGMQERLMSHRPRATVRAPKRARGSVIANVDPQVLKTMVPKAAASEAPAQALRADRYQPFAIVSDTFVD